MHISSRDNPKIKHFVKLATSKKYRREAGQFVLEGARSCKDAFDSWLQNDLVITACFATNKALEKYSDYIDSSWFESFDQFYTIDEEISQKISDSQYPQGIFVIAEYSEKVLSGEFLDANGKYLILDDLQDPGNVGTLLRTADAVGVDAVIMCKNCCELYNPKVLRSAVGSIFRLNIYSAENLNIVAKAFEERRIRLYASVIDKDAVSVTNAGLGKGCGVVLGNEGNGLCADDVSLCDERITIRMHGNINSLNVATAGSIILWEMCRGDDL